MVIIGKNGRSAVAMVLNEPVNGVCGIAQCNLAGCEASLVLLVERDGKPESPPRDQLEWFLANHECNTLRYHRTSGPAAGLRPGQRVVVYGAKSSWGRR